MPESGSQPVVPIACQLSDADLRRREETLLAQFKSAVMARDELEHGYAFHLPGDEHTLALVAGVIAAERACCPFLTFELFAAPGAGPLVLRISGPSGAKQFLQQLFA